MGVYIISNYCFAQQITVSGKVLALESGSPIPGVNVIIKGSTIGTVTNIDGSYKINVPNQKDACLIFSFIGLATEEVTIGSQAVIDMVMTAEIRQLSGVIITAVGIESDKAALGYSIQSISDTEISNTLESNIVNSLNQKAAGVYVYSTSGSPGASSSIRIRGNTSITLGNSPLFVVDGVPINNWEANSYPASHVDQSNRAIDLNPADVASLTVLKGPAATVLYGIRAANGAIIITTKKGEKGKPKITFSTSYIASQVNKLPGKQSSYAQGRTIDGVPKWQGPETHDNFSYGPKISDLEFATNQDHPEAPISDAFDVEGNYLFDDNGFLVTKGTGNGKPAISYPNNENFFVTGHSTDNNLSISGGNDNIDYYISTGYLYQSGIVPKATWSRISVLGNFSAKLNDHFKIGAQINYINSGGYRVNRGSNTSGVGLALFRNTTTFDAARGYTDGRQAANDPNVYILPDGTQRSYNWGDYDNPFFTVNGNPMEDNVNRIIGNINASWQAWRWMTVTYKLGLDNNWETQNTIFDINSAVRRPGLIALTNINSNLVNSDILFLFNFNISEKLHTNATLGYNYFCEKRSLSDIQGQNLGVAGFNHISNATNISSSQYLDEKKIHGLFADVLISWDKYLFLNVSARNDWSSTLPKDNNSFFYPAVSLGWTFTENLGLSTNPFFSYGKLRISWGQVGNDAPVYSTNSGYVQANIGGDVFIAGINFPAFGVNAFEKQKTIGNPDLRAELTSTLELGGEFEFFQGRFGLDITYYKSESKDQIMNVGIPPSTGFRQIVINTGLIGNKGWELMLHATPVNTGNFVWNMNMNFTQYESLVKELDPRIDKAGIPIGWRSRAIAGEPYGVLYGERYKRIENSMLYNGKLIIDDNGWPIADTKPGIIGDPNPDWLFGWRNTFSYKGIALSGLLDIRHGGDMYNGTVDMMNYYGIGIETEEDREVKGFVFDGVINNGTNEQPVWVSNNIPVDFANPKNEVYSYKWVRYGFGFDENAIEDASWIRLREVSLSYTFPKVILDRINMENLSISLVGRNLFLHTSYTGIDPETNLTGSALNGFGADYFGMPNTKSYSISLNLTF